MLFLSTSVAPLGVSDERMMPLLSELADLRGYTYSDFRRPGTADRRFDVAAPEALTRRAYWVFALLEPAPVEVLAARWLALVGTDSVTFAEVVLLAAGGNNCPPAVVLAEAGELLRSGVSLSEAAEATGLGRHYLGELAEWMDVAAWRADELFDEAYGCLLAGVPVGEFAARHGRSAGWGRTLYARARRVAAELGEVAA